MQSSVCPVVHPVLLPLFAANPHDLRSGALKAYTHLSCENDLGLRYHLLSHVAGGDHELKRRAKVVGLVSEILTQVPGLPPESLTTVPAVPAWSNDELPLAWGAQYPTRNCWEP